MRVQVVRDIGELQKYRDAWSGLAKRCANGVFNMPGWAFPWLASFGTSEKLFCFLFFDETDELIAIIPMMIRNNRFTSTVTFIGHPLNDCNEFIVEQKNRQAVLVRLIDELARIKDEWDIIECDCFEAWQIEEIIRCDSEAKRLCFAELSPIESPTLSLPGTMQEYFDSLSSKWKKNFKKCLRKIEREDTYEVEILTDYQSIRKHIAEFDKLRLDYWIQRDRLEEIPAMTRGKEFREFLYGIAGGLSQSQSLAFPCVRVNGDNIAMGLYFIGKDKIHAYMSSWNIAYQHLSPGKVVDLLMIDYAITKGITKFDFGRGNEQYKYEFAAEDVFLSSYVITRENFKGILLSKCLKLHNYWNSVVVRRIVRAWGRIVSSIKGSTNQKPED